MSATDEKVPRKPQWLKIKLHKGTEYASVAAVVREHDLHTICSSGKCPNISECWSRGTATFMIGGDVCTRCCRFCATSTGRPAALDLNEPVKVARSIKLMGLRHAVITSVTRDDLTDGGAAHWAETVRKVRELNPETTIELLIPDFDAKADLLDVVIAAQPDILGHNIETVERLTPEVRSRARYATSMAVIRHIADSGITAKSGIMVGLGETDSEVVATLYDLHAAGCSVVTIGQYLQPTKDHLPVAEYVHPDKFAWYKAEAEAIGFDYVVSDPMVRSSYMAEKVKLKGRG